jgi:hypothetical protein
MAWREFTGGWCAMSVINLRELTPFAEADPAKRLQALRSLMAEKYPEAGVKPAGVFATGVGVVDEVEGGLRRGAVTELVGPMSAGALFTTALLLALEAQAMFGALIDAGSFFDPQGADPLTLPRLLWVRCAGMMPAVKAADLLLRDGNLPVVVLDLQGVSLREVRRVPASTWHRFQRLAEPGGTALVVLSSQPVVEGAQVRIAIRQRWTLDAMRQRRSQLLSELEAQVFSRRDFSQLPSGRSSNAACG